MPELHNIDDIFDIGRILVLLLSVWCFVTLIRRHRSHKDDYNTKTLDYWYAMFMWSIVGIISMFQGILLDRPVTPATIAVTAAVLVTGKGLHQKGPWGGKDG